MSRHCGSCVFFVRIRSLKVNRGICDKYDCGCGPEDGKHCQGFKPKKTRQERGKRKCSPT